MVETVEDAAPVIAAFVEQHNERWIVGRLRYSTPVAVRRSFANQAA